MAPVDYAQLNEAQRAFWSALDELSEAHREITLLRHVQDLSTALVRNPTERLQLTAMFVRLGMVLHP